MKRREDLSSVRLLDYCVFLAITFAIAAHRSVAYGFAFGWLGGGTLLACTICGVVLASLVLRLFFRKSKWEIGSVAAYLALNFVFASACTFAGFRFFDRTGYVSEAIAESKIEYFCANHFNHADCVYNVRVCPDCAKHIVRYKRLVMAENLEASDRALRKRIAEIEAQKKRQPANKAKQ